MEFETGRIINQFHVAEKEWVVLRRYVVGSIYGILLQIIQPKLNLNLIFSLSEQPKDLSFVRLVDVKINDETLGKPNQNINASILF